MHWNPVHPTAGVCVHTVMLMKVLSVKQLSWHEGRVSFLVNCQAL